MRDLRCALVACCAAAAVPSQPCAAAQSADPPRSAPISDVRYELAFDAATAQLRAFDVTVRFRAAGDEPVLLSLPAWTPGAYEIANFARNVSAFSARAGDAPLRWDRADHDTWRIFPRQAGDVAVTYRVVADSLDPAMAWARPDFLLVNGTTAFPYPEGRSLDFAATVSIRTQPDWRVATGMAAVPDRPDTFHADSYHDLVDHPLFVGRFDADSLAADGLVRRLVSYPEGALAGKKRRELADRIGAMIAVQAGIFGDTPFDHYTTMLVFDESAPGATSLEHHNSQVGIYHPRFLDNPVLPLIIAHGTFHAWNAKRLRPADLVPYRYDAPQPTPWLWVVEGVTSYYTDLTLVRAGIAPPDIFLNVTNSKLYRVQQAPAVSLEDASVAVWTGPRDGTYGLHYDKGSLTAMVLDILIRDASDNRSSLDSVLRELYRTTWKRGRGFTDDDWWGAVSHAAGGMSFDEFRDRFVDGREPLPWSRVLPAAGMRFVADTVHEPRIGVETHTDERGARIARVEPGSMADEAGARPGDFLLEVGGVPVDDPTFGARYRQRFTDAEAGTPLDIVVRRGEETIALPARLRFHDRIDATITFSRHADSRALDIRNGILGGR